MTSLHPCLGSSEALTGALRPQLCGAVSQGRQAEGSCGAAGARLQPAFVLVVWSSDLPAAKWLSTPPPLPDGSHPHVPPDLNQALGDKDLSSEADRWLQVLPRPCGFKCVFEGLCIIKCECEKA